MISYDSIKNLLLVPLSETEIVNNVKTISSSFNFNRDRIKLMYNSEPVVASYSCFYMPTNAQKMSFLLSRLNEEVKNEICNSLVIDIGTGPGTYIFSLLEAFKGENIKFIGIDQNKVMLEQAKLIRDGLYPDSVVDFTTTLPELDKEVKKTLIFGNSLNEMGPQEAWKIISKVDPDLILFIEPGTKLSFGQISSIRTTLIKANYNILYPCQGDFDCPIVREDKDDWCHQVVRTRLDDSTLRLSQMVSLDRSSMPAIIHVYSKTVEMTKNALIMRLIKNAKHAFIWEICLKKDDALVLQVIEVPKRYMSKDDIKNYSKISTGLSISFEEDKMIGDNVLRVKNIKIE